MIGLNSESAPEISEQILLQILRDKLVKNFDLNSQSAFEKSIRKKTLSDGYTECRLLKCILDVHNNFPRTNLFLLKSSKNEKRITLVMIGENNEWLVKHEVCLNCGFSREEMVTNLALIMKGYFTSPLAYLGINSPKTQKSPTTNDPKNVSKKKCIRNF